MLICRARGWTTEPTWTFWLDLDRARSTNLSAWLVDARKALDDSDITVDFGDQGWLSALLGGASLYLPEVGAAALRAELPDGLLPPRLSGCGAVRRGAAFIARAGGALHLDSIRRRRRSGCCPSSGGGPGARPRRRALRRARGLRRALRRAAGAPRCAEVAAVASDAARGWFLAASALRVEATRSDLQLNNNKALPSSQGGPSAADPAASKDVRRTTRTPCPRAERTRAPSSRAHASAPRAPTAAACRALALAHQRVGAVSALRAPTRRRVGAPPRARPAAHAAVGDAPRAPGEPGLRGRQQTCRLARGLVTAAGL